MRTYDSVKNSVVNYAERMCIYAKFKDYEFVKKTQKYYSDILDNLDEVTIGNIAANIQIIIDSLKLADKQGAKNAEQLFFMCRECRYGELQGIDKWIDVNDLSCFEEISPYDESATNVFITRVNEYYKTNIPLVGELQTLRNKFLKIYNSDTASEIDKKSIWVEFMERRRDAGEFSNGINDKSILSLEPTYKSYKLYLAANGIGNRKQGDFSFQKSINQNFAKAKIAVLRHLNSVLLKENLTDNLRDYVNTLIDNIDEVTEGNIGLEINDLIKKIQIAYDKSGYKLGAKHLFDACCKYNGNSIFNWIDVNDLLCFENRSPYDKEAINEFIINQNLKYGTNIPLVGELEEARENYFELFSLVSSDEYKQAEAYIEYEEKNKNSGNLANGNHYGNKILSLDENYIKSKNLVEQSKLPF
ncbi:MAG: hypothetical protein R3Y21_02865 [Mycoplasmatota bacterium]